MRYGPLTFSAYLTDPHVVHKIFDHFVHRGLSRLINAAGNGGAGTCALAEVRERLWRRGR